MLIAHWPMDGNTRDRCGAHNGRRHGVEFVAGVDGRREGAVYFDGESSFIQIEDHPDFHFGEGDFTVAAWVRPAPHAHAAGDLFSKFDAEARKGFHLTIGSNSSGYSSISDNRTVLFGIDNGVEGSWTDCGKPREDNTLVAGLVVYQNRLYAGIADALTPHEACRVYRYEGDGCWSDAGRLGSDPRQTSVSAMIVHNGDLYAGCGLWDWTKNVTALRGPTRLYRYRGGTDWEHCGAFGKGQSTVTLASYQGSLYTGDDRGQCFRYDGDGRWEFCGQLGVGGYDDRMNSLTVWRDRLYGVSLCDVYVYEGGRTWTRISQQPLNVTQLHKIHVFRGQLLLGTWPEGKVLRYVGGDEWENLGANGIDPFYQINEVNDLLAYNGKLYAGVIPKSEVYRFDRIGRWKTMAQLLDNPGMDVYDIETWCRVPSLATYGGLLYASASTCHGRPSEHPNKDAGRVFSFEAGKCVSYDDDIGTDWTHVAAVRSSGRLQLYVNGRNVSEKSGLTQGVFHLSNELPLLIGKGAHNCFKGAVDDMRVYRGALHPDQIRAVKEEKGTPA